MTSSAASEIRVTLEVMVSLHNQLRRSEASTTRQVLVEAGFSRSRTAPAASFERLDQRIGELGELLQALPGLEVAEAIAAVNEQLTELPIAPAVMTHDGVGPHLHWTATTARFDDQVMADICMALAVELCDEGTRRFGHCQASGCDALFYDTTRNRSRRFCDDPRCASRTHTAAHRARQRRQP